MFRIRYGPRPQTEDDDLSDESEMIRATPPSIPPAPPHFNLTSYSGGGGFESSESDLSDSEDSDHAPTTPIMVTVEKPGALARGDWEKFQSKVSRQLLARYFYSCELRVCGSGQHVGGVSMWRGQHVHGGDGLDMPTSRYSFRMETL